MKSEANNRETAFGRCPYVTSQKLLSGKWAILILYALSEGPKRFGELQREVDITQATLSTQLKTLEREGLIHREVFPEVPPRVESSLTEIGQEFRPVLESIEIWGNKYINFLRENRPDGSDPQRTGKTEE